MDHYSCSENHATADQVIYDHDMEEEEEEGEPDVTNNSQSSYIEIQNLHEVEGNEEAQEIQESQQFPFTHNIPNITPIQLTDNSDDSPVPVTATNSSLIESTTATTVYVPIMSTTKTNPPGYTTAMTANP